MTSLEDALADLPERTPGPSCSAGKALAAMPSEDRATYERAVAAGRSFTILEVALRKLGYDVSSFTLGRHHRGSCKCPRP